jgi:uncharacterized protein YsxB (DUF464 family)
MILVEVKDEERFFLKITGHAKSDQADYQIICETVGSSFQFLILLLEKKRADISYQIRSGECHLQMKSGNVSQDVREILETFVDFCQMLANQYPKSVSVRS